MSTDTQPSHSPSTVRNEEVKLWYHEHEHDYRQAEKRLEVARNVLLHGREQAAMRLLEMAEVYAVLSIKADGREQRAFVAYIAGDCSIETATSMVPYPVQKADWIHHNLTAVNNREIVHLIRDSADASGVGSGTSESESRSNGNPYHAVETLTRQATGLSYKKAGLALSMAGLWEVCETSSKIMEPINASAKINSREKYEQAVTDVDNAVPINAPVAIKQWAIEDNANGEYDPRHPFFRETVPSI